MVYVASAPVIKCYDVAFVKFIAPEFAAERDFFVDFGLQIVASHSNETTAYMKGQGAEPVAVVVEKGAKAFGGLGIRAKSVEDLEVLARKTGGEVESMGQGPWPAETKVVRLRDPDGYQIEVIAGGITLGKLPALPPREGLNEAAGVSYPRKNKVKRITEDSSHVVRLGHVVLDVSSFLASEKWYKDTFGLITSDEVLGPDGKNALGAFMRCDRGNEPCDHHTIFLVGVEPGAQPHFNHAAFEVVDFDDLMVGNALLNKKKAKPVWGVGRHKLGSQIFDYWNSPAGFTVEHWTDGDLLNKDYGSGIAPLQDLFDTQWGMIAPSPEFGSKALEKSKL